MYAENIKGMQTDHRNPTVPEQGLQTVVSVGLSEVSGAVAPRLPEEHHSGARESGGPVPEGGPVRETGLGLSGNGG